MKTIILDEVELEVLKDHAEIMIDDLESQRAGTSSSEIEQLELDIAVWQGILDQLTNKPSWHTGAWSEEQTCDLIDELREAEQNRSLTNEELAWLIQVDN